MSDIIARLEAADRDIIAAIVCKHVPPQRMCDHGRTCPCWAEYAVPAADEIVAYLKARQHQGEKP